MSAATGRRLKCPSAPSNAVRGLLAAAKLVGFGVRSLAIHRANVPWSTFKPGSHVRCSGYSSSLTFSRAQRLTTGTGNINQRKLRRSDAEPRGRPTQTRHGLAGTRDQDVVAEVTVLASTTSQSSARVSPSCTTYSMLSARGYWDSCPDGWSSSVLCEFLPLALSQALVSPQQPHY